MTEHATSSTSRLEKDELYTLVQDNALADLIWTELDEAREQCEELASEVLWVINFGVPGESIRLAYDRYTAWRNA